MVLLSQINESGFFELAANKKFAMADRVIPKKFKILMALASATATGAEKCINTYTKAAFKNRVSKEEIIKALIVIRFVKSSSVLSASSEALCLFSEK